MMRGRQTSPPLITETSISNFIPLEKIGEGSFSSVYKVRRINDDEVYALKKVKIAALKEKQKQNALNEIRILASINSQNIVEYKEAFFDQRLNLLCIVMQWADQGDLQKKVDIYRKSFSHFPEKQIWRAAIHIIQGLYALHSKSILHRDMKSANVFISNGIYKLGDLNVSKVQSQQDRMAYTQTGTPYYASPQVWRDEPYNYKSDIWSLGCIIYEMCNYRPPFKGKDLQSLFKSVQKGTYEPISSIYSCQLSDFINLLLRKNPHQRPSTSDLLSPNSLLIKKSKHYYINFETKKAEQALLNTIKLPLNLRDLKKKLPKSKYEKEHRKFSKIHLRQSESKKIIKNTNKKFSYIESSQSIDLSLSSNRKNRSNRSNNSSQTKKSSLTNSKKSIIKNHDRDMKKKNFSNIMSHENKLKTEESILDRGNISVTERKQKSIESVRKLSYQRNKGILKQLSDLKKIAQPLQGSSSQRYREQSLKKMLSKNQFSTQRARKKSYCKRSQDELIDLELKIEMKRKQLRKIGSIQHLNHAKNNDSYYYRLNGLPKNQIKKTAAHSSNIILKSSASTQAQPNKVASNEKKNEDQYLKRLEPGKLQKLRPISKVNSTPYIIGLSEAPRMKKILEGLQSQKKTKELQIKKKLFSNRYISQKY